MLKPRRVAFLSTLDLVYGEDEVIVHSRPHSMGIVLHKAISIIWAGESGLLPW